MNDLPTAGTHPGEPPALAPDLLYRHCDPAALDFLTTTDLADVEDAIGQQRATDALEFGVGIRHDGYNLFVVGSPGLGKSPTVRRMLEQRAAGAPTPPDCCLVHNFRTPHKPIALLLPPGTGVQLQRDMRNLMRDLIAAIPAAFDSDDYRARTQEITDEFKDREERIFAAIAEDAMGRNITVMRTPGGYTIAPMSNGEVIGPDEFAKLTDAQKQEIERNSEEVRQNLRRGVQESSNLQREHHERMERLNGEVASRCIERHLDPLLQRYRPMAEVGAYLAQVRDDIVENVDDLRKFAAENKGLPRPEQRLTPFNRYFVNVLVDRNGSRGAPVVFEDYPTYQNLVGRIEHLAHFGTLLTDFTLVKAGALLRASGGYLILDARKVLMQPFAWEALKRALRAREARIQPLEQMLSLASTITLEPEPVPLDLKVVLTGDRALYYLLSALDPDVALLFKVQADFAEDFDRSQDNTSQFARLIATLQRQEKLRPMDRGAVARMIEHASRRSDDAEKLSLHREDLLDNLREADYWAQRAGSDVVQASHVSQAIDAAARRADQLRERMHESILRDIRRIATSGSAVAQINGLAVVQLGKHAFGHPSRITATARPGDGTVIDIEREAELGGAIHSKGVLILSSFLAQRYGQRQPQSLTASLVFEQTYGMVEGDSASAAELCALLSALSGLPLRQDLAITGSVDQSGAIQAIGGVNEKIEGFFDICKARGLSGSQGVLIPAANVKHLMLRADVVSAARDGRFRVWAVDRIDTAMQLLTGVEAGVADADGGFPPDSVNGRVQQRLREWAELLQRFAHPRETGRDHVRSDDQPAD
ncbi:ATP-binding protein [Fontimonas sp. SYSU GA230001]|uniref:Lon protease family protein n=1 Tax=Fontimonas sp. SYSU GA230001 TaxID=3142450 RepID=UPI0032B5A130